MLKPYRMLLVVPVWISFLWIFMDLFSVLHSDALGLNRGIGRC